MHKTFAGQRSGDYNIGDRARPVRAGDNDYADSKTSGRRSTRVARSREPEAEVPAVSGLRQSDGVPEGFYRDLVWNLRNGVLAVTRDGRIAVMNDVAYRILGLTPRTTDIGLPYTAGPEGPSRRLAHRRRGIRSVAPAESCRAQAEEHRESDRLHALAGARSGRRDHRRDALLQGPDPRRAARGTRAAPRSACGPR